MSLLIRYKNSNNNQLTNLFFPVSLLLVRAFVSEFSPPSRSSLPRSISLSLSGLVTCDASFLVISSTVPSHPQSPPSSYLPLRERLRPRGQSMIELMKEWCLRISFSITGWHIKLPAKPFRVTAFEQRRNGPKIRITSSLRNCSFQRDGAFLRACIKEPRSGIASRDEQSLPVGNCFDFSSAAPARATQAKRGYGCSSCGNGQFQGRCHAETCTYAHNHSKVHLQILYSFSFWEKKLFSIRISFELFHILFVCLSLMLSQNKTTFLSTEFF